MNRGLGIRLYLDEDVQAEAAEQLRQLEYDVICCRDSGRSNQGIDDEDQLAYATELGRALFTYNVADYVALDKKWKAANRRHRGIVISDQLSIGEVIRRLRCHLDYVDPSSQNDNILWLTSCPA